MPVPVPVSSPASRLARWRDLFLRPSEGRFMALVGAVVGVWLLAVLAFNALVDPLALTPWDVRVTGFNAAKTEQIGWDPLFKYYQLIYRAPDLVLLGSSRIEQGVDPGDSGLAGARSPYNLGVIGANMEMIDAYWRHALRWSERVTVAGFDDSVVERLEETKPESLEVIDLGLEDAFVDYTSRGSRRRMAAVFLGIGEKNLTTLAFKAS